MLPAIIEIHQALLKSGYTEEQADELVTRLMQEEAYEFTDCMRAFEKSLNNKENTILN